MQPSNPVEIIKKIAITALEDGKGLNIVAHSVTHLTSMTDYMIFCTGSSSRHIQALGRQTRQQLSEANIEVSSEGENNTDWILLDTGHIMIHIMLECAREFYDLESFWYAQKTSIHAPL